jgi:hypothetical protein
MTAPDDAECACGRADSFDSGRYEGWQQSSFNDSAWQPLRTTIGWDTITPRVLNNSDVFGANGIYERMFLYAK